MGEVALRTILREPPFNFSRDLTFTVASIAGGHGGTFPSVFVRDPAEHWAADDPARFLVASAAAPPEREERGPAWRCGRLPL